MKEAISYADVLEVYRDYICEIENMANTIYYNLPEGHIGTKENSNAIHELQTMLYEFAEELTTTLRCKVQGSDLSSEELEAHELSKYVD